MLVDVLPPPGRLLILLFGDESNNATTFLPRSGSDGAITLVLWLAAVLNENAVLVLNTSIAKAIGFLRSNRPLRAEELCRDYLIQKPGCTEH